MGRGSANPVVLSVVSNGERVTRKWKIKINMIPCNNLDMGKELSLGAMMHSLVYRSFLSIDHSCLSPSSFLSLYEKVSCLSSLLFVLLFLAFCLPVYSSFSTYSKRFFVFKRNSSLTKLIHVTSFLILFPNISSPLIPCLSFPYSFIIPLPIFLSPSP